MSARDEMRSGGRAPVAKARVLAALRDGGTAEGIAEAVGCTRAMVYKTLREAERDGETVEVVGYAGTARVLRLGPAQSWPFDAGEMVKVSKVTIDAETGERRVVLRAGRRRAEVVIA